MTEQDDKAVVAAISHWQGAAHWEARELALIGAEHVRPICPDLDLWDCWPMQHEDGATAEIGGVQYLARLASSVVAVVTRRHGVVVRHAVAIVVAVAPACSASRRVSGPTPREMSEACAAAPPLPPSPESAQREPKRLWPDLDAGQSDPNEQAQREPLLPVAMSSSSPVTPSPSSSSSLGCDLHISNFACGCVEPRGVVRVMWRVVVMRGAQV